MSEEPRLLREPAPSEISDARVEAFRQQVNEDTGRSLTDYEQLWQWSVTELEEFWEQIWQFLDLGPRRGPVLVGGNRRGGSTGSRRRSRCSTRSAPRSIAGTPTGC